MGESRNSDKFYLLGLQNHCGWWLQHETQRCLLFGRRAVTNLNNILQSRDITFPTKIHIVKAMIFPVVIYRCESWTIKKAEHQGVDAFELWYWRRLLRVPWTERKSTQSILKEINTEYPLEGLMLKLKFQYFAHLMWRLIGLIGKDPDSGKDWRQEEKGISEDEVVGWHHWLDGHEFKQTLGDGEGQGSLVCCSPWNHKESDTTEQMNNNSKHLSLRFCFLPLVLIPKHSLINLGMLSSFPEFASQKTHPW